MKYDLIEPATIIQDLLKSIDLKAATPNTIATVERAKLFMARYYGSNRTDKAAAVLDEYYGFVDDLVDTANLLVRQTMKDGLTDKAVLRDVLELACARMLNHTVSETFQPDDIELTRRETSAESS